MNPAMTVAPFAWEMLLAASNLWTITYVQSKDDKLTRFKTIKYFKSAFYELILLIQQQLNLHDLKFARYSCTGEIHLNKTSEQIVFPSQVNIESSSFQFILMRRNQVLTNLATITWSAHQYQMEPGVWPSKNPAQGI